MTQSTDEVRFPTGKERGLDPNRPTLLIACRRFEFDCFLLTQNDGVKMNEWLDDPKSQKIFTDTQREILSSISLEVDRSRIVVHVQGKEIDYQKDAIAIAAVETALMIYQGKPANLRIWDYVYHIAPHYEITIKRVP